MNFRRFAPIDEKLRESAISTTCVDPSQPRLGGQPSHEDITRQPAPGSHHLLVGGAVVETDNIALNESCLGSLTA